MDKDGKVDPKELDLCFRCKHFLPSNIQRDGFCHRFPPTFHPPVARGIWPPVYATDSCGEWQEEKDD